VSDLPAAGIAEGGLLQPARRRVAARAVMVSREVFISGSLSVGG